MRVRNNWKGIARSVFYVVRAMPIARQRVAKHIPAEAKARNNRASIARQRRCKQALLKIQAMFSVGSVQSCYKRVEFRSWQFSWIEGSAVGVLTNGQQKLKNLQETSSEDTAECWVICCVEISNSVTVFCS
jgi:hypothetical protein